MIEERMNKTMAENENSFNSATNQGIVNSQTGAGQSGWANQDEDDYDNEFQNNQAQGNQQGRQLTGPKIKGPGVNVNHNKSNGLDAGFGTNEKGQQGVELNINGADIKLQPGTSVTIGKNGQLSFSSNQVKPDSVQSTAFPGDSKVNQTGFDQLNQVKASAYLKGLEAGESANQAYGNNVLQAQNGQMLGLQSGNRTKQAYSQMGKSFEQTAGNINNQQQDSIQDTLNNQKQNTNSKQLDVDKSNEMTL